MSDRVEGMFSVGQVAVAERVVEYLWRSGSGLVRFGVRVAEWQWSSGSWSTRGRVAVAEWFVEYEWPSG